MAFRLDREPIEKAFDRGTGERIVGAVFVLAAVGASAPAEPSPRVREPSRQLPGHCVAGRAAARVRQTDVGATDHVHGYPTRGFSFFGCCTHDSSPLAAAAYAAA